jgi:hypothetical protein
VIFLICGSMAENDASIFKKKLNGRSGYWKNKVDALVLYIDAFFGSGFANLDYL